MARIGTNPMKWIDEIQKPKKITITTIVYIPYLDGYWEKSLEVLQLCINSLIDSMEMPFDLLVFDNGSCNQVLDYLTEEKRIGKIQFLILSDKNLGKVSAWNIIFSAAPGEIIVYTDSDVLFFKGWLEESLNLLDAFPKAGMITAQPARGRPDFYEITSAAITDVSNDTSIKIRKGKLIPLEILEYIRIGLGYSEEYYKENNLDPHIDFEISRNNTVAYASASHFQFLTKKSIIHQLIPFKVDMVYGGDNQLEKGVNTLGFWLLSTKDYLVHHIGNDPTDVQSLLDSMVNRKPTISSPTNTNFSENKMNYKKTEPAIYIILRFFMKRTIIRIIIKKINFITNNLLSVKR